MAVELPPAPRRAPEPSTPAARARMRANRSYDTAPERALRSALHRRGLRFRKHVRVLAEYRCRPDIVFPRERVVVFLDGCFWHGCPQHWTVPNANRAFWMAKVERNRARAERDDFALAEAGWSVVRCWEHEDTADAANRVEAVVRKRRLDSSQHAPPARVTSSG
jgi:DNA mismatch endonuclease (patch repair protein)